MIERIISVGNKVDVENIDSETKEKRVYKSQVFDIMSHDEVRIAMPFEGDKMIVMSLNVRYKLCFHTDNGLFECVGHVIDRYKSKNRYVAVLSLETGLRKIQRREFFRLEKLIDVDYRVLTEEESNCENVEEILEKEMEYVEPVVYKKGIAVDLSGGGARFVLDETYPISTYVLIRMHIDVELEQSLFYVIGKVVMSEKIPEQAGQCENRIEFVRLEESEREKLIHYIFKEERKLRRIGKR